MLGISLAIAQGDKKKIELYESYVKRYVNDKKEGVFSSYTYLYTDEGCLWSEITFKNDEKVAEKTYDCEEEWDF